MQIQKMVDKGLADLATSENPAQIGDYKPSMRIFSYRIGTSHRIIYSIRYNDGIIELLRVFDHKSVYGKD
jgi:mRNA-degrading endonuclease RelE of RelBE toxin-antitoxin system